jgi:hypothetical protein
MLSQSIIKELMSYDPGTGEFVWLTRDRKWFKSDRDWMRFNTLFAGVSAGGSSICTAGKRYFKMTVMSKKYLSHRIAWMYVYGRWPKEHIDHINGNGEDNRLSNLREVRQEQNNKNARRRCDNISGTTGVHWYPNRDKWVAVININGKKKCLGYYSDLDEACQVRKKAEVDAGYHVNHGENRPL